MKSGLAVTGWALAVLFAILWLAVPVPRQNPIDRVQ